MFKNMSESPLDFKGKYKKLEQLIDFFESHYLD